MNDIIEKIPYLFPVFFIGMWVFVSFLLSLFGGWRNLGSIYLADGNFAGEKFYFQSLKMGFVNYNSCVNIGVNENSIYISVFPIFRVGHPPLRIPLSEIQGKEYKGWFFRYVNIKAARAKDTNIKLFKKQADRIEQITKGTWQYERHS